MAKHIYKNKHTYNIEQRNTSETRVQFYFKHNVYNKRIFHVTEPRLDLSHCQQYIALPPIDP